MATEPPVFANSEASSALFATGQDGAVAAAYSSMQGPITDASIAWKNMPAPHFEVNRPTDGSWFEVTGLASAGFGVGTQDARTLFARKQVVDLWESLDSFLTTTEIVFSIYGSPGTGKSSEVWAWACQHVGKNRQDVLWVHLDKLVKAKCVESRSGRFFSCEATPDELSTILNSSRANVVIIDGYQRGMILYENIFMMLSPGQSSRKNFVVSSLGAGLRSSHLGLRSESLRKFEMDPWTLAQYLASCTNLDFFDSVSHYFDFDNSKHLTAAEKGEMVATLVKKKFYLAGASARWMFDMSTTRIRQEIVDFLEEVSNVDNLMSFAAGPRSAESNNHLLMKFRDSGRTNTFFVSQCALEFALQRWSQGTDVKYAYSLAEKHRYPAFLGWVVQFDFFDQIRTVASLPSMANKISVLNGISSSEDWIVNKVIDFNSQAECFKSDQGEWEVNHWMLPELWNQAGYDAACLILTPNGKLCLKILQITKGQEHILDLNAFATLIGKVSTATGLEIPGVNVVFLMPKGSSMPKLKLKGEGSLESVLVGGGPDTWKKGTEVGKVAACHFNPYCKASA